jgi:hydroxyacylglutathione hydrolase
MMKKYKWACEQQEQQLHTVPSTIGEEKLINPFMRVCQKVILEYTRECNPTDAMARLRTEKDCFTA